MTSIEITKQKIINLVMGMDNGQALEVLYDVMIKFGNPSPLIEDELTDEEWGEIENDIKEIEEDEIGRKEEVMEHLKQWKSGK